MESAFPTAARLGLHVLLYSSLLLNALFVAHHLLSASPAPSPLLSEANNGGGGGALSWALRAARDAESVAAAGCSGHGRVFLVGIVGKDGRPGCEGNTCFEGPDCSVRTPDCTVDADRYIGEDGRAQGSKKAINEAMQLGRRLLQSQSGSTAPPQR